MSKKHSAVLLSLALASLTVFTYVPFSKWQQFKVEAENHRHAILKDRSSAQEYAAIISAAASATNLTQDQRWLVSKEMKVAGRTHERFESMEQLDLDKAENEIAWWWHVLIILPTATAAIWLFIFFALKTR